MKQVCHGSITDPVLQLPFGGLQGAKSTSGCAGSLSRVSGWAVAEASGRRSVPGTSGGLRTACSGPGRTLFRRGFGEPAMVCGQWSSVSDVCEASGGRAEHLEPGVPGCGADAHEGQSVFWGCGGCGCAGTLENSLSCLRVAGHMHLSSPRWPGRAWRPRVFAAFSGAPSGW